MPSLLELSVVLTTYQRPEHLLRSLASLAHQQYVEGRFEVVVADDGSTDCTRDIVHEFAETVDFPVKLTSHLHCGFRVAMCRNDGIRASAAPYLLFSDGDCVFPHDHLRKHLRARRPGIVRAGDCYRLDQQATERLDMAAIAAEVYRRWVSGDERRRILGKLVKDPCYQLIGHATKPKLTGCNIGIARSDIDAVNGFDESFVGWGCEDDDLAYRLRKSGVRIVSVLHYTCAYHMWHPMHPTRPEKWADGPNVARLQSVDRPILCRAGVIPVLERPDRGSSAGGYESTPGVPQQYRKAA
jgi:glycosyltransferase involved in cell wall biosynthesis